MAPLDARLMVLQAAEATVRSGFTTPTDCQRRLRGRQRSTGSVQQGWGVKHQAGTDSTMVPSFSITTKSGGPMPVKALPTLRAAESVEDLAKAMVLHSQTPRCYEIEDPAEANAVRALNVVGVLADYMRLVGDAGEDLKIGVLDLLVDLHHLTDAVGVDWDEVLDDSNRHYRADVAGEL
ncbi:MULTISPECIES: hypothetical protein [unclassified Rhodococcus (in: high G+C Gram-positive bacteria)]|uniref:hypothetical protein n=1 Tax=unclassified Rhodococcus (in: high G+C Gram-positive bacteria) TaxID=192944 RepID=UPI001E301B72|nr:MULTISPECIES: hypothetical protein [unclassified Rhodococcus (in: high G+C Gram-positive bacteria)]WSE25756.1 hypothetical protein U9J23_27455 [Rhodococcus sp. PD04]